MNYNNKKKENIFIQKIYFVCSGTNCNDIIESVNKLKGQNSKKAFSFFRSSGDEIKKIAKEKSSRLDDIGMCQINNCRQNNFVKSVLLDITKTDSFIYTSMEKSCVESGLVLYSTIPNIQIHPFPYLSNHTGITNKQTFIQWKGMFPKSGNSVKYWDTKGLVGEEMYEMIKANVPSINLKDCEDINIYKFSGYKLNQMNFTVKNEKVSESGWRSFNKNNFLEYLKNIIINHIEYTPSQNGKSINKSFSYHHSTNNNGNVNMKNIVFICEGKVIENLLTYLFSDPKKNKKFISKNYTIENSSVWEISAKIHRKLNNLDMVSYGIQFADFEKKYPTEYQHNPLTYKMNTSLSPKPLFKFSYKSMEFQLFNSLIDIPKIYLNKLPVPFCLAKSNILKKIESEKEAPNKSTNLPKMNTQTKMSLGKAIEELNK